MLSIKGEQTSGDSEPEIIELQTEGSFDSDRAECYILSYEESELTGLAGTKTTFYIYPDSMTLMRQGTVNTQMIFQDGQRYQTLYQTRLGALEISISTRSLHTRIEKDSGIIEISYAIEMNHEVANVIHLHIDFWSLSETQGKENKSELDSLPSYSEQKV